MNTTRERTIRNERTDRAIETEEREREIGCMSIQLGEKMLMGAIYLSNAM